MKAKSNKQLNVWKKGMEIVERAYEITENLAQKGAYGLASQMQRCAISIPSNIAEGFARGHTAEYRQSLRIALRSYAELDTQLIIAHNRNYTTEIEASGLQDDSDPESLMIMNLIKSSGRNAKS